MSTVRKLPAVATLLLPILGAWCGCAAPEPNDGDFAWTVGGDQRDARFGASVSGAGDVDRDGVEDLLVGAPFHDAGEVDEGRVSLFLRPGGIPGDRPAWTRDGGQKGALLGASVSGAGDLNHDGYADIAVGAPRFDDRGVDEGEVLVFLGTSGGLPADPVARLRVGQGYARFGTSIARVGDVDGDGFDDLLVGAPGYDGAEVDEGAIFLFRGGADGVAATPSWVITGGQAHAELGRSVTGAGDVNGDGFADIVAGSPAYDNGQVDEGVASLFLGSAAGPVGPPAWRGEVNAGGALFGSTVEGVGDLDGDGFADLVVAAPSYNHGQVREGRVFLYAGSASGLSTAPVWSGESNAERSGFGASVAAADWNHDGFMDLAVGAPDLGHGEPGEGAVLLFAGSAKGLAGGPAVVLKSDRAGARMGHAIAALNGTDLLIGAYRYDDGSGARGRVFLYRGGPRPR